MQFGKSSLKTKLDFFFEKNQEILTKSVSCAKLIKVRGY